ncbi:MAG TPA: heme-binding domain-containing protein [Pyrinomonadaceae bacterium]|nr:heme-binding domain-containing protein [Pyrinomonadaceae bacterium]
MIKKILKVLVIVIVAAVVVLQFFRIDKANPPVVQAETLEAAAAIPPDISLIIGRSCNDCHSNQTIYPWYSNVQPMAWFLKSHIDDGRQHLNFSIWNTYTPQKRSKKLEAICDELESKDMPLPSYLWIHRDAVLSENDSKALCDWAKQEKGKVDAVIAAAGK